MGTETNEQWKDPDDSFQPRESQPGQEPVEDTIDGPIEDLTHAADPPADQRATPPTRADLGGPVGVSNPRRQPGQEDPEVGR
jgi:hypothetical protein